MRFCSKNSLYYTVVHIYKNILCPYKNPLYYIVLHIHKPQKAVHICHTQHTRQDYVNKPSDDAL